MILNAFSLLNSIIYKQSLGIHAYIYTYVWVKYTNVAVYQFQIKNTTKSCFF